MLTPKPDVIDSFTFSAQETFMRDMIKKNLDCLILRGTDSLLILDANFEVGENFVRARSNGFVLI